MPKILKGTREVSNPGELFQSVGFPSRKRSKSEGRLMAALFYDLHVIDFVIDLLR